MVEQEIRMRERQRIQVRVTGGKGGRKEVQVGVLGRGTVSRWGMME